MDHMRIHTYKTRANKKHKGQQLLNDFILYSLTTLACTSFCSSPLWYPPFCATFNVFFFFSLPKITSFFFTSKALFIVGNLIVIFLLGESKFFASKSKAYNHVSQLQVISISQQPKVIKIITEEISNHESMPCEQHDDDTFFETYNDEETYECVVDNNVESSTHEEDLSCSKLEPNEVEEEKHGGLEEDMELSLPAEELNKLADDFIARIIRQRKLEAEYCRS
ncbi:unnamed protein product [Lactuca saligna]|uniref:DUF4408 domain-containing protein n=1 Tax=Lactuca saligna TaxID=75948 RepID=A0AA36E674_LACSI|nr:unnamed protein product [Lactuca saligna]